VRRFRALVSEERERLWLGDDYVTDGDGNEWIAQPGQLDDASARSLEVALSRIRDHDLRDYGPAARRAQNPATGESVSIATEPRIYEVWAADHDFDDPDYAVKGPVRLILQDAGLRVRVAAPWDGHFVDEDDERGLERLVKPVCDELDVACRVTSSGSEFGEPEIELLIPTYRRTIRELLECGNAISALLIATQIGPMTPETARGLVRGAHVTALVGQPESAWLDAKRLPPKSDLEFAKDVAAMANTGRAGILVYGFSNRKTSNGDQLAGVTPFHRKAMQPPALQRHLLKMLRPRPLGVEIEVVEVGARQAVGFVFVPGQEPTRLPLMFNGVRIAGKVRETFVAIPVRVGEETYWEDSTTLHGLLSAGRAALRGPGS
jgi:hypothetical protein